MRALVAEDHPSLRHLYCKWLSDVFEDVETVSDGAEAVSNFLSALMDDSPYSFILLDIMMPELYGNDVLKEFRMLEKEYLLNGDDASKIVVITGSEKNNYLYSSMEKLIDSYIEKPVKKDDFFKLLKNLGY